MKHLSIWHISDGKPGHRNQVLGLLNALESQCEQKQVKVINHKFDVSGSKLKDLASLVSGFSQRYPQMQEEVTNGLRPDLIIAAGSSTHISAFLAGKHFGRSDGKTFVMTLMKPSLPLISFDLSIVPHHDGLKESERVWVTEGVINHVKPSQSKKHDQGMMLIGGPSKHHDWSELDILGQIQNVLGQNKDIAWRITNSRRTPLATTKGLHELNQPNVQFVPHELTDSAWLTTAFQTCEQIWVSEDSVSMVSESLTSGASVGLFAVPIKNKRSRVVKGLNRWVEKGLVTPYPKWQKTKSLNNASATLHESERIGVRLFELLAARFDLPKDSLL